MKYAFVCVTILLVWLAVIIIATLINSKDQIYDLYKLLVVFTLVLFFIGFGKISR
jgi:hypothetical protein